MDPSQMTFGQNGPFTIPSPQQTFQPPPAPQLSASPPIPPMPTFGGSAVNPMAQQMKAGIGQALGWNLAGQMMPQVAQQMQPSVTTTNTAVQPPQPPPASNAPAAPAVGGTSTSGSGTDYKAMAASYATQYGVPPQIFTAQIQQESGFNPNAKSPVGATGIAQIMPQTAQGWGVDPTNPQASLQAAAKAMSQYHQQTGSWSGALIAYNAGMGGYQTYKQTGYLPDETKQYLQVILGPNWQSM